MQNFALATEVEAKARTSNDKYMTPLRTKQALDAAGMPWTVVVDNYVIPADTLAFSFTLQKPFKTVRILGTFKSTMSYYFTSMSITRINGNDSRNINYNNVKLDGVEVAVASFTKWYTHWLCVG